ncbi:GAF domain-containing protein [Thermomonas sp.]|uniref:GAF domain-containing protein n=1 Tax=Thermomonas sp. TaxID=1971895 RepID=UPI002CA5B9FE|nr:GAF domain-containing protein [Thermomonas sp.]HRO62803.1 GAF domain-containing protein [Thermomonas sp.]
MDRWRLLRIAVTVLVLGLQLAYILTAGNIGRFPLRCDNAPGPAGRCVVLPLDDVPLPTGLQPGDVLYDSELPLRQRLAIGVLPAGHAITFQRHRGATQASVHLTTIPSSWNETTEFRAGRALNLIYLALGLLLLWRGRDAVAWNLAGFCLALVAMQPVWNIPTTWGALDILFARLLLMPLREYFFFAAARSLAGNLPRRLLRWITFGMAGAIGVSMLVRATEFAVVVLAGRHFDFPVDAIGRIAQGITGALPALLLLIGYRHADAVQRLRIRWFLLALALLAGLSVFAIFVDLESGAKPGLLLLVALLTIPALLIAYAALRNRLVEVSYVVSRTFIYSTMGAVVVGVFVLVENALSAFAVGERQGALLQLGIPLALGLALNQLHKRIERVIERLFFRRQFAAEQALHRLAHESTYIERPEHLLQRTLDEIARHLRPARAAIYRREDDYRKSGQTGAPDWPEQVDPDDPLFVALRADTGVRDLHASSGALGNGGLAAPMHVAGRLHGAIVLGERAEGYSPDERELLRKTAQAVGSALYALKAREDATLLDALVHGRIRLQALRQRAALTEPPSPGG